MVEGLFECEDPITLEDWKDVKDGEDVVSVLPEAGGRGEGGYCMRRKDLAQTMESTVVWRWLPDDPDEPRYGRPDRDHPFYKGPYGLWLTPKSLAVLKQSDPQYSLFQLERIRKERLGTALAVSSLHGDEYDVYELRPIMTRSDWIKSLSRRRPSPLRRPAAREWEPLDPRGAS